MAEHRSINDYFSLWGPYPVFGGKSGTENRRQIQLFFGVALGAVSKTIYDALSGGGHAWWKSAAVALIASIVVFPQLYYTGGLNKRKLTFAHWTLAFQSGFFWNIALDAVARKLGSP